MKQEQLVLSLLVDAFNEFSKLEQQHSSECEDFTNGIHLCQYVIAMRFARYYRNDVFPIKEV